jgi:methyl-accepting chemotaxis protein
VARGAHSVRRGVGIAAAAGEALDAIAEAARQSAARTAQVVGSSAGQSDAVRRVSDQMGRVREGVELIRRAGAAQEALHEAVRGSSQAVREGAAEVSSATEEQARGMARIGESIETVRAAVEYIGRALEDQLGSIRQAGEFLEGARGYTTLTQDSARQIDDAMRGLRAQAEQLRARVAEFRI